MKRIEEKLEYMNKVTPDLPLHRAHLRRALMASRPEGFNLSFMKKLLPVGLVLALLLMFNAVQKPDSTLELTPRASAAELVSQVLERVQNLSPEDLLTIQEKLHLDSADEIDQLLLDAQAASDLAYMDHESITCEEAAKLEAAGAATVTSLIFSESDLAEASDPTCESAYVIHARPDEYFPEGFWEVHVLADAEVEPELTYLEYTNAEYGHVVLGLSEDLLPIYTIQLGEFIFTGMMWNPVD